MGFPAAASSNMRLCSLLILQYGEMFTPLAVTATTMLLTLGMHSKCVCDEVLNLWYVLESSNFAFISCKKKKCAKACSFMISSESRCLPPTPDRRVEQPVPSLFC